MKEKWYEAGTEEEMLRRYQTMNCEACGHDRLVHWENKGECLKCECKQLFDDWAGAHGA